LPSARRTATPGSSICVDASIPAVAGAIVRHEDMSQVRIAVAGAGLIGRRPIELIQQSRSCRLAAIVDPAPAAADIARRTAAPLYRMLGELFARERPDGVIVATPNKLHVEQALACVAACVPALIEKPVAGIAERQCRLQQSAGSARLRRKGLAQDSTKRRART
jgi:predicted dehydrogenase